MKDYGYFSENGQEYIIKDMDIPRKWENFLWNDEFLCRLAHDGTGTSFYRHPEGLRSELIKGNRRIYIADMQQNSHWYFPGSEIDYQCRHGLGYTTFTCQHSNVNATLRITVPQGLKGEAWTLSLHNPLKSSQKLRVMVFAELELTGYPTPFGYKWSIPAYYEQESNCILYVNQDASRPAMYYHGFVASDKEFTAFETVGEKFFGIGKSDGTPVPLLKGGCESTLNRGGEQILAVLQYDLLLPPEGKEQIQVIYGVFEYKTEVEKWIKHYLKPGSLDSELDLYLSQLKEFMRPMQVRVPDQELNRLFNLWAKNNLKFTTQWTRVYSRGFRDSLQDAAGVASLDAGMARKSILEAMNYVYRSGRCRRAWANVSTALSDEFYSDGPVWIPLAINAYISETGDTGILYEKCSYYDGGTGTVLEHMLAAVRFLYNDRGDHGLCLIHDGDWCDTANLLGKKGKGEGVWLTIALYKALNEVKKLAEYLGDHDLSGEMSEMAEDIKAKVNIHGWDGNWFLIAYNDEGRKIGSSECREGKIFLNPQSWAVISEVTDSERARMCLEAIDQQLDSWVGPLLLAPPYTERDDGIGSITGFHPGTIENGSCYCHAACFKIVADCIAGRGNKAMDTLMKIIPGGKADKQNPIADCPPYAFTNCRISAHHPYFAGRHLNTWITGTVSWCWQVFTQWILGIRPTFEGLMIDPCIPDDWNGFSVTRVFRDSVYEIELSNPAHICRGVREIYLDGRLLPGNILPVSRGKNHKVTVLMG